MKNLRYCGVCEKNYVETVPDTPRGDIPLDHGYRESLCPVCLAVGEILIEDYNDSIQRAEVKRES